MKIINLLLCSRSSLLHFFISAERKTAVCRQMKCYHSRTCSSQVSLKCQLFSDATGPVLSLSLVTFWAALSPWIVRNGLVEAALSGDACVPESKLFMGICAPPVICSCCTSDWWWCWWWWCCCTSWYRRAWCCSDVSCWVLSNCWNCWCCWWSRSCLCWSGSNPSPEALQGMTGWYCSLYESMGTFHFSIPLKQRKSLHK